MIARRALLFTDLADSTALAERLGAAAASELWARHDAAARALVREHGGREIDKADGFLLMFERAADAVACALAYHAAVAPLGLQARAGVHLGDVALREAPAAEVALGAKSLEVDGPAKHVAARIMSVASSGQTLVSAAVAAEITGAKSHGFWRLKGIAEPLELFEVGAWTPPKDQSKAYRVVRDGTIWLPAREIRTSLPRERDRFVGREADLAALAARLDAGASLVTVTGAGGAGKTRLVTRYAWAWLGEWPGGAWFCDLCDARDAAGIATAVANGLDISAAGADPLRQIGEAIAGRGRCLVILDNFEQVAALAAGTLTRWLERTREAVFVVTSRQVLGVPGEEVLPLEPLRPSAGVELFLARAEAARGAPLDVGDRPAVEQLVDLLDGLPLAIELAAARTRAMPAATVLARMSDRFGLLRSAGGRPDRHATLEATLDGSWELLPEAERSALARLSAFSGGFTLAAAERVLDAGGWAADLVQSLVDRSLVRRVRDDRFDLLVSVREYAAARLAELGQADAVAVRHLEWAVDHVQIADTLPPTERVRALAEELANLEAATRRAIALRDPRGVTPLAGAWGVWVGRGPIGRGAELARALLDATDAPPAARGQLLHLLGESLHSSGRAADAVQPLEDGIRACRDAGDPVREARSLHSLAGALLDLGQTAAAEARSHESVALARAHGERRLESLGLARLGTLQRRQGRFVEARANLEAALAGFREQGYRRGEISTLTTLGGVPFTAGDMADACAVWEQGLALAEAEGDDRHVAMLLSNLGAAWSARGEQAVAVAYLERSLAMQKTFGNPVSQAQAESNLAAVEERQGRYASALERHRRTLVVYERAGNLREVGLACTRIGAVLVELGEADSAREPLERALAVLREVGDRSGEGSALANLGVVVARLGDPGRGEALASEGEALLEATGSLGPRHAARVMRAEIAALAGDRDGAERHLAAAEALGIAFAPDSSVARRLGRVRRDLPEREADPRQAT